MVNAAQARILIVDDEASARDALEKLLGRDGHAVDVAEDGVTAMARFKESPADVVVTDLNMPNMDGMTLLTTLRALDSNVPVIVLTASGELHIAVAAMRAGADDYLTKPLDFEALTIAIERALERRSLRAETEKIRREMRDRDGEGLHGMVGVSAAMQKVYRVARQVARARATVLITGESGTGKGELARAIHALGNRSAKPFVSFDCSLPSETLFEDALFGHRKHHSRGAEKPRAGIIERADGGTLFLDEIGEMPMAAQVRLLRVLQERTFERVDGNEPQHIDVRVIAATKRDLAADVRNGRFRGDLLDRLNVLTIELPALRIRHGDILVLANHFLRNFAEKKHAPIDGFSEGARAKLLAHQWPGNVRALQTIIARAVALCDGILIAASDLHFDGTAGFLGPLNIPGATMAAVERYTILTTLDAVGGSAAKTATMLGLTLRTIQSRLSEYAADHEITGGGN
jgi:two-component system response regulator HydG